MATRFNVIVHAEPYRIGADTGSIQHCRLFVYVADEHRVPVTGLKQSDFTVRASFNNPSLDNPSIFFFEEQLTINPSDTHLRGFYTVITEWSMAARGSYLFVVFVEQQGVHGMGMSTLIKQTGEGNET